MTSKKTIFFYINSIHQGGAERVIIQLAHHFATIGFRAILLTSFVDGNLEYPIPANVERRTIEQQEIKQSRLKRNWSRIKALRILCKQEKPVAVVSFMREPNFRALCATVGLPVKCFVSVRNDPKQEYHGLLGWIVGKFLFRLADGVIFQTREAQAWFPQSIQQRSAIIFNPVQDSFFQVQRAERPQHIVTCGRLSPQKNQALLIRAFAQIAAKFPQENLLIYGKGELEDSLRKLISQLNLQHRVFLMGLSEHVENILSKAKLFVLPSDFEGMPNALMEALTVGVPSIATDCPCGGPRELIQHGKNGLLVPCNKENALVQAMDNLLSNPPYAAKIAENARQTAQAYKSKIVMQQWKIFLFKDIQC